MKEVENMLGLFLQALGIGFSGAMMPGPLLTVTISESARRGFIAGPLIVLGHAILELSLVIGLVFGLGKVVSLPVVSAVIGIAGGVVLLWMGWGMLRSSRSISFRQEIAKDSPAVFKEGKNLRSLAVPVAAGIFISLLNPYWSLWWATIGLKLVTDALRWHAAGLAVFFAGHIMADFIWYVAVAGAVSKGREILSDRVYRVIIAVCGIFLVVLSFRFIGDGIRVFR